MALADRDYMRNPPRQRGRTTRLDAAPTDGVIWGATVDRSPADKPRHHRRRAIKLTLWLTGGIAVFTALWAIGCGTIAAQWHGQGTTFKPPAAHSGSHTGGSSFDYQRRRYRSPRRLRVHRAQSWKFLLSALTLLIPAYREAKRSGWFPDRAVELPFPESGTVTVNNSVDPRTATSRIKVTAGEANAVVQLFDRETDAHVISVYVNRNEDMSVPVPPGTYRMKIVEGDKWHGLTTWFGPSTTYETVVKPMVFTRRRYPMIDLHRSPVGNLRTSINITNPKPLH